MADAKHDDPTSFTSHKRPRMDSSMSVDEQSSNTQELQSWFSSSSIKRHMTTTTNTFKSLLLNTRRVKQAFEKLQQYKSNNTIPKSIKSSSRLSLPATTERSLIDKANALKHEYEQQQFMIIYSAKEAELSIINNKSKQFMNDQKVIISDIIQREHDLLQIAGLHQIDSVDEYVTFFMSQLLIECRRITTSIATSDHYKDTKDNKSKIAESIDEAEAKLLNNPGKPIAEIIKNEVAKQLKQNKSAPKKSSLKQNEKKDDESKTKTKPKSDSKSDSKSKKHSSRKDSETSSDKKKKTQFNLKSKRPDQNKNKNKNDSGRERSRSRSPSNRKPSKGSDKKPSRK